MQIKLKKIFICVMMALCILMSFSATSFANIPTIGGIEDSLNSVFSLFHAKGSDGLAFTNGFNVIQSTDTWDKIYNTSSGASNGDGKPSVLHFDTGIDNIYNLFFPPRSSSPTNGFGRNDYTYVLNQINTFADKSIQYITDSSGARIYCDRWGRPYVFCPLVQPSYFINTNLESSATQNPNNYYSAVSETNNTYTENYYTDNSDNSVTNITQNTYNKTTNTMTIGTQIIDPVTNQFYDFSTRTTHEIDSIYFNEDNSTYYVTTRDGDVYNDYSVSYTYNYTYINYIGSSEEFTPKAYKLYYALPDGRSSADLTIDEIGGMSFQFDDVTTYDKVATSEVVKGLWHLDGSLENYTPFSADFKWSSGSSITYLESANFGGALYCPPLSSSRDFSLVLDGGTYHNSSYEYNGSSCLGSSDGYSLATKVVDGSRKYIDGYSAPYFSLDFRFYSQADAGDNSNMLNLSFDFLGRQNMTHYYPFNVVDYFKINGNSLSYYDYSGTGNVTHSFSVGVWNNLHFNFYLVTSGSYKYWTFDLYLNGILLDSGVRYYSSGINSSYVNYLRGIRFRSSSNTVPFQIDEIRVTTSNLPNMVSPVPYDDNFVWVLPSLPTYSTAYDSAEFIRIANEHRPICLQQGYVAVSGDHIYCENCGEFLYYNFVSSHPFIGNVPYTLALQTESLSGNYRVGGIRPSMVEAGHVWFQISLNRIVSCQVYNGVMWEEVNCYVHTGQRWIPANYFDVVTLTDYYDIADNTGLPTITTEEGFYTWFQREFKELKEMQAEAFDYFMSGGDGAGSGTTNNNTTVIAPNVDVNGNLNIGITNEINTDLDLGINIGSTIKDGVLGIGSVFKGFYGLFGSVISNIGDSITIFFDFYDDDGAFFDTTYKPPNINSNEGGEYNWEY